MGDKISCCDARTQLENASLLSQRTPQPVNIAKTPVFTLPPMSLEMRTLITKVQKSQYFKAKIKNQPHAKQTVIFGTNHNGALYEGETFNQTANGYGTVSFANGTFFQGNFTNGEPTNGIFIFNENSYYVGDIENFQSSRDGAYQNTKSGYYYEGQWKKNLQHGKGIQKYSNGDQYRGQFMCGSKFGQGQYKFADGKIYKGLFYNGLSDGHGILTLPNGDVYDGEWRLGQMHGRGIYKWKNGQKYQGQYAFGVRQNIGKYYFSNGATYEGGWNNGLQQGEGIVKEGYDEVRGIWQAGHKVQ